MKVESTGFAGLVLIEPTIVRDVRGYFLESYNRNKLRENGIEADFVQDNQSSSRYGVLRGLHFQNAPFAQTKLIRVLKGTILDIAVDLRREEPTFGKYFAAELSAEANKQLLIPKGFAHGFIVLSAEVEVLYKIDEFYNPAAEGGIAYNDPLLAIDWKIPAKDFILSERDKLHPSLAEGKFNF